VFQTGQITPAASSVMATYFVEQGLTDDKEQIDTIAVGYRIDPQDVMRDIDRQQAEVSSVHEGLSPENMPDSWKQILGNCLGKDK
jgi:formyltetrahydrofolate synthetase